MQQEQQPAIIQLNTLNQNENKKKLETKILQNPTNKNNK